MGNREQVVKLVDELVQYERELWASKLRNGNVKVLPEIARELNLQSILRGKQHLPKKLLKKDLKEIDQWGLDGALVRKMLASMGLGEELEHIRQVHSAIFRQVTPLFHYFINKWGIAPGWPQEEFMSEAHWHTIRAIDKFHPGEGDFLSYLRAACHTGRLRAIYRYQSKVHIPLNVYHKAGKALDDDEGVLSYEEFRALRQFHSFADKVVDDRTLEEVIPAPDGVPEDLVVDRLFYVLVEELLKGLPEREEQIVRLCFGLNEDRSPMTLRQVGAVFDISYERVRQIRNGALEKLNTRLKEILNGGK